MYDWRKHQGDESYWVTGRRAADILGVNVARLGQLVSKGFVPFVVHIDGTRLYRRQQREVVANARDARCTVRAHAPITVDKSPPNQPSSHTPCTHLSRFAAEGDRPLPRHIPYCLCDSRRIVHPLSRTRRQGVPGLAIVLPRIPER